jgi:hypothetical protein
MRRIYLSGKVGLMFILVCSFFCFGLIEGTGQCFAQSSSWLEFDGADDKAVIGDSASLDITNFITLEAWIRAESIPSSGGQARIVSKSFHYELSHHSADSGCVGGTVGDVQWRGVIGGLDRRICGGSITPGTWHHVAGTCDGSDFFGYVRISQKQ